MTLKEADLMSARLPANVSAERLKAHVKTLRRVVVLETLWYPEMIGKMKESALSYLEDQGMNPSQIEVSSVPGSFEIPLAAQNALRGGADFVVALGCVLRGDTPHFDYVCQAVSMGIMQVSLQFSKPIGFGVLTVDNMEQAYKRSSKGAEAAQAALFMSCLSTDSEKKG